MSNSKDSDAPKTMDQSSAPLPLALSPHVRPDWGADRVSDNSANDPMPRLRPIFIKDMRAVVRHRYSVGIGKTQAYAIAQRHPQAFAECPLTGRIFTTAEQLDALYEQSMNSGRHMVGSETPRRRGRPRKVSKL